MAAGGAAAWELSPARRRRWGEAEDEEEPPAVLTLSHFSRPPFLSFGRVRLGVSRARLLGIDNPDAAAADVTVDRFPPPARGFGLERRRFLVQVGPGAVVDGGQVELRVGTAPPAQLGCGERREPLAPAPPLRPTRSLGAPSGDSLASPTGGAAQRGLMLGVA